MPGEAAGILAAVASAVAFSTASIFIKLSLRDIRNPFLVNGIRALFASVAYAPVSIYVGVVGINPYTLTLIVISTVIGPGIGDVLFIMSIDKLGAGLATVLSYQYILIAQILSIFILHDYRGFIALYLTPLALVGMYLAVSEGDMKANLKGVVYSYSAAIAWASSTILVSYLVNDCNLHPIGVAGLRVIFLAPMLMSLGAKSIRTVTKRALAILGTSGIISYFIGFILFTTSLKILGVMIPSLATALTPMLSQLISNRVLSEALTPKKIIGSSLIIASLVLVVLLT
ncbi:MAG: DMT family transporter [Desulfurococcales archaeon]|nr:DMT family transporter [Desulfurococcales archaeon]